jgi:hypothetical protein
VKNCKEQYNQNMNRRRPSRQRSQKDEIYRSVRPQEQAIQLSRNERRNLHKEVKEIRYDFSRFSEHYNNFYKDHQQEIANLDPQYKDFLESIKGVIELLENYTEEMSDQEVCKLIERYNVLAGRLNRERGKINRANQEGQEKMLLDAANGNLPISGSETLNAEQKEELKEFVRAVWAEVFPESNVNKTIRWITGQEKLEGWQKGALAPVNGIEIAVTTLISMTDPQTYEEMWGSMETLTNMSKDDWLSIGEMAKITYDNLEAEEAVAPIASLLCSLVFFAGGAQKVLKIAQRFNLSSKVTAVVGSSIFTPRAGIGAIVFTKDVLPIAAMTSIVFPVINLPQ